jgi:MarR family 2-MHQ and catechol resistance regulon transcriptional repressor
VPTHFKGDSETKRALNALINLSRAANSVQTRLSAGLDRCGITTSQLGILEALFHLGPMCQRALGDKLLRSGGNITMVIDNLEKHGLVERMRLISRVLPLHAKDVVKEMSRLTASEQEELRRLCRKLGRGGEVKVENDHDNSKKEEGERT